MTVKKTKKKAAPVDAQQADAKPDPLALKELTPAEVKALDRISAQHPEAIHKLDQNTQSVVINGRVFVGQWHKKGGERQLSWSRARTFLSPTEADFESLDSLPVSKMIDLDSKTVGAVIGDKVMIGKYQITEGERQLFWSQAGRLGS